MKATLPTNYQDDILNVSTEGKRKYRMNYNDDGTVSLIDVTPYDQEGSDFGAGDINATNQAVNESFDKNKLISDIDAISAVTEEGYAPDALIIKELKSNLQWWIDNGYLPDPNVPTVYLYNKGNENTSLTGGWSAVNYTAMTKNEESIALKQATDGSRYTLGTTEAVDLTNYSKLVFAVNITSVGGNGLQASVSTVRTSYESGTKISHKTTGEKLVELDVSALSGLHYVTMWTANISYAVGTVSQIYLVP